jgi:hypothetical protein
MPADIDIEDGVKYEAPACVGQLTSLCGVKGRLNKGLLIKRPNASVNITTDALILHANPRRVFALIQNCYSEIGYISFDSGTGIAATFQIRPGETLQLDKNIPWTGPVYYAATVGQVNLLEAEVQSE